MNLKRKERRKMQKLTKNKKRQNQSEPKWYLIDATNVRLGKLSSKVASLLLDKQNVDATTYQLSDNYVIIINSDKVSFHPSRRKNKMYYRHSGYPGGLKQISLGEQMKKDSKKVIETSISGMLPKNKLRSKLISRVKIYKDDQHKLKSQKPINIEF
jgi:large subunit ribosomal protein L13